MFLKSTANEFLLQPEVSQPRDRQSRLVIVLAVLVLTLTALLIHYLTPLSWNVAVMRTLQSVQFPGLHEAMRLISGFGNAPKVIAITAVALLALNKGREALWLTWSGLGGWFLSMQLKHVFASPRPTAELVAVFHQWPNGSFPSGHLVFYVCYFSFLFFIAREHLPRQSVLRPLVLIMIALPPVLVGVSRVYLGEHWPSDLPGSYLLGSVWSAFSLMLYRRWRYMRKPQHDWFLPYRVIAK
jgi:membrane-associated phospholipid phosphatase